MRRIDPDVVERNYSKVPLDASEVRALVDAAGSVAAVLNTRHATAKGRGWKERSPSKAEFARAVGKEPNLLRRPILVKGGRAVVGFDEKAMREVLRAGSA